MTPRDKYHDFATLDLCESGHYNVFVESRNSRIAMIAPHGGGIEPGTSEITKALAGNEFSAYCFEGMKSRSNNDLHITSAFFDEPKCAQLVNNSQVVVAIHGCADRKHRISYIGGLDGNLKIAVMEALRKGGFNVEEDDSHHSGRDSRNLCNRGGAGRGLQIEITEGLRRQMFEGLGRRGRRQPTQFFDEFVAIVRGVLLEAEEEYRHAIPYADTEFSPRSYDLTSR